MLFKRAHIREGNIMKKILIVVDMQKDFVDGALGSKEAVAIVDNVVERIENFDGDIIVTYDTHYENYMETAEGKRLPVPHCIKDTEGWQISDKLNVGESTIIDKLTFGSVELSEYIASLTDVEAVEFVGLCTDICVISNVLLLKAKLPETAISVDSGCCAGVTPESHSNALNAMKMCQIEIL